MRTTYSWIFKPSAALGLALIGALFSHSLWAQGKDSLDEIIVTATKRDERVRDVPMAIFSARRGYLRNSGDL